MDSRPHAWQPLEGSDPSCPSGLEGDATWSPAPLVPCLPRPRGLGPAHPGGGSWLGLEFQSKKAAGFPLALLFPYLDCRIQCPHPESVHLRFLLIFSTDGSRSDSVVPWFHGTHLCPDFRETETEAQGRGGLWQVQPVHHGALTTPGSPDFHIVLLPSCWVNTLFQTKLSATTTIPPLKSLCLEMPSP